MQTISAPEVPTPRGHYSHGVQANGLVFVSGMLPTLSTPGGVGDSFAAQVHSALGHCRHVLAAAGCGLDDVVQCTAYIVGIERWPEFNDLYAEAFGAHRPARAVVPVPELHHGALVELQMIACAPTAAQNATP